MPITKSAKKALRQNLRRHKRNLERKRAVKDTSKGALKATQDARAAAISLAYKAIDKAATRGVIKKNTAARKKARLMRAIHRTKASR
ncbi:MAG: hypothetical protein A2991_00665 [Candidatus Terrybacteria bacterium RIFCSPLOWO2_01_FULL_58_14]|uniref:Small ribosomal subunit protein bS20 n=2 Tax=Candidatus Terryibacteriota TaxID=1817920 RepID=A0A1G2PW73_9BACT|nr:MAG: hypothetical protein A2682_01790 [Candidatus Terrybacteria bacterium RIFCSPHIGHO2_01_FULL_58_15]OHA52584.1 MAG: hypothetical protein A2991_00665 [Candidatus Terrybacteria bacterium RIFCSPLOWO2_01_FULL_58_14]